MLPSLNNGPIYQYHLYWIIWPVSIHLNNDSKSCDFVSAIVYDAAIKHAAIKMIEFHALTVAS